MSRTFDVRNDDVRDLVFEECARVVRAHGLLVIPTDTVYGVAADAFSKDGVARLLAAKGRGRDMPPPVLVGRPEALMGLTEIADERVLMLTKRFWPGPLTIICTAQPFLDWDLGDTHGTVAIRMPDDERVRELLTVTGPLAVSSANTSGSPAATTVDQARSMLGDAVDIYLDGGLVIGGRSSTIVDMTSTPPRIVRPGPVSHAELVAVVDDLADAGG